jgi:hypothetical protein
MPGKGGSKTRAGARGNEKSYRSSLLEIGSVGYFFRRRNQIEKGSQANRRKGEQLSTTVCGCTAFLDSSPLAWSEKDMPR